MELGKLKYTPLFKYTKIITLVKQHDYAVYSNSQFQGNIFLPRFHQQNLKTSYFPLHSFSSSFFEGDVTSAQLLKSVLFKLRHNFK